MTPGSQRVPRHAKRAPTGRTMGLAGLSAPPPPPYAYERADQEAEEEMRRTRKRRWEPRRVWQDIPMLFALALLVACLVYAAWAWGLGASS